MVKLRKDRGDRVNGFIKELNPISDSVCIKQHSFEAKILKHVRSFAEEHFVAYRNDNGNPLSTQRKGGCVEGVHRLIEQAPQP